MNLNLQLSKTQAALITAFGICSAVKIFCLNKSKSRFNSGRNNLFSRFFITGINQNNEMNYQTALRILNVSSFANRSTIMKNYYHLMKKNHPDTGGKLNEFQKLSGSNYLASLIVQAKKILLE